MKGEPEDSREIKTVKENKVAVKSEDFAVRIVRLARYLNGNGEYIMAKQVLRSGTSIGANVAESQNAQSAADFISKLSISLKEAGETAYWLRLLKRTEYISENQYSSLIVDLDAVIRLLVSIIKSKKAHINSRLKTIN